MNSRYWIFIAPLCLACAACGGSKDASPDAADTSGGKVTPQQTSNTTPAAGRAYDAADLLLAQDALREEFDGWERDAADESKPLEERQAALGELAEHARVVSGVEKKAWGTVRNDLIDEESAKVLRRLALDADKAEIRTKAVEALGQLKDIDGMDVLIVGMEDESLEVRQAAVVAVRNIMSTDYGFRADGTPSERKKAVAAARQYWEICSANARFVEGVRNPAQLKRWKAAARWKEPSEERFRLRD